MSSTAAQKRASKKYTAAHKEQHAIHCSNYYIANCERLKTRRMERYYLKKQQKAQLLADLSQSALERIPHVI